jgi:hypothetical protein
MSILDAFNTEIANMGACTISIDPLQYDIYEANAQLSELNLQGVPVARTVKTFVMPSIPDICIDPNLLDPPATRIFTLQVDLRLFQSLFWYKNYSDGFVKYAKLNKISQSLLKCVNFLNATNDGTVVDKYIDFLQNASPLLHPYIQQKIKLSLYSRFTSILASLTTETLFSVVNTFLNQMTPNQSASSYSPVPFMEGDMLMFYGLITSDIPGIASFDYGIQLVLTTTLESLDYTEVTITDEFTDTYILLPMTNGVIQENLPLTNIVHAYLPVNLNYTLYKNELLSLYSIETTFSSSLAQADSYHVLYTSTNKYLYEMYAIYILTQISLYFASA